MSSSAPAAASAPRRAAASAPRSAAAPAPRTLHADALGEHRDRLLRAAVRMTGSRADAEDLVQDVCVKVLVRPRVVRGEPIGYLLGILRNEFVDQCRAQARRRTTPVEPAGLEQVVAHSRWDPELHAQAAEVVDAVATLPPGYRDAVLAVDVLGLPYADAAAALDVPAGTVMSRLSRGRAAVARSVGAPGAA